MLRKTSEPRRLSNLDGNMLELTSTYKQTICRVTAIISFT